MNRPRLLLTIITVISGLIVLHIILNARASEHPERTHSDTSVDENKPLSPMDSLVLLFDKDLTQLIDSLAPVGTATVVTHNNRIIYQKCTGVKQVGGDDPVDEETMFRLASVSKTITGVLAGMLHHDQIVGLDDKVTDYLSEFKLKDTLSTATLTVRNILSHTSGLVPHAYDNLVEAKVPFSVIMDSLWRVNISDIPGRLYGYQNVMFSLYDTIAAIKTGLPFDRLLKERLFYPFGMRSASAGYAPFADNPNKAMPHIRSGKGYRPIGLNDRYYNTNPAAGINASISDMGKFLLAINTRDPHLMHPQVIDTVLSPQVVSPLRRVYLRQWNGVESKHYGLGWRIIGYNGCQVAYHGGYVRGYRAEIAVCRDQGIGIAFLSNSPGSTGSYVIPMFLDLYFKNMQPKLNPGPVARETHP
jgi:beta-lactamase class C